MEEKPRPLSFNYGFIGLPGRRVSEAKSRDCDSERGDEASTCFTDEWPTPGANADMSAGISAFVSAKGCPPDPILGMRDDFERDPANSKMNLAVGVYRTAEGSPLVLRAVQDAEAALLADQEAGLTFKEYLPSSGLASFCEASLKLLLGNTLDLAVSEKRVVATQALSGVGGLHLAARMIAKLMPHATVYLPSPSWPIHQDIFEMIGVRVGRYPYYDPSSCGLDFDPMINSLTRLPAGSIVLLHPCAHNPTGVDLTAAQWKRVAQVVQACGLIPLVDSAYQGLASGDLDKDAYGARMLAAIPGVEMLFVQSFAKNMGLYGERTGTFAMVLNDAVVAERVRQELARVVRLTYSSPPQHGAAIATKILREAPLTAAWKAELALMAERLRDMRTSLHAALERVRCPPPPGTRLTSWSHVLEQRGMFTYSGLTAAHVKLLREKHHIYMPTDGRISMASLTTSSCDVLAAAIKDVLLETSKGKARASDSEDVLPSAKKARLPLAEEA